MPNKENNKHIGPCFDDFLAEEGVLEEAEAVAKARINVYFSGQQRILPNTDDIVPNMPWVTQHQNKKEPLPVEKQSWFSKIKSWMFGEK